MVCTFLLKGECRDLAGGVRPDSGTVVLLYAKERREVLVRIRGGGTALPRRSGGGGQANGDGERGPSPATREAEPGTPMGDQETRVAETSMVKLAATALKDGGTPSDTPEQQNGSPPLPLGGSGISQTLRGSSRVGRRTLTLPC